MDDTIVTEMMIGREGQTDYRIDVNGVHPDLMVCFEVNQNEFTWKKIETQRQLHHIRDDLIS